MSTDHRSRSRIQLRIQPIAGLISVVAAALLVVVTVLVTMPWAPLPDFDDAALREVHDWAASRPAVVDAATAVAQGWRPAFLRVLLLFVALVLWRRGLRPTAVWVLTATVIEATTVALTKVVVGRVRPELTDPLGTADGGSFPSGHASGGALLAGVVMVVASMTLRRQRHRMLVYTLAIAFALLLGLDRIILGVHHPSDVVASYLLVTAILCGLAALIDGAARRPRPAALRSVTEPRMSRLAVVLNPIKVADAHAFRRTVNASAQAAGWDVPLWFETTVDDAGREMAHAALTAGADVVVAAGGDGTVRIVASELARTGVALGILPAGTGNLLARNLGLPLQMEPALEVVLQGQDRAIDLALMSGDHMEPERFAVMGGLGLDAAIMQGAPDDLKKRMGWPAYFVSGMRHLRDPAVRVEICVDDKPPVKHRARTVVIGNVGTLTGGIPLLPDAAPDDGQLDVVVVAPPRLLGWFGVVLRVLTRHRRVDETLNRLTGREVVVKADHAVPRQLDGDTCGLGTEVRASIEPGVLLVRVPR
ncbi:MAG TPA: diacylglycerol kinase family protein [Nocardioidaceae bacterium]|nr:diacylglycerol kinase family protein [Nocardioidaceae bacterium]